MKRRWKIGLSALAGVVTIALAGFGVLSAQANARLARKYETHRVALELPAANDQAAVLRGRHLVEARYGCKACHGENLAGGVMLDDPAIGSLRGPNLTRGKGGRTAGYTLSDWDRIVRHGVKPDGTAAVMPSEDFFAMSDAELVDIVSYLKSLPPVDAEVPPPSFGPVGMVLLALGKLPISAERQDGRAVHAAEPPVAEDSVKFGEHLAATCTACHGRNLAGGPLAFGPPEWPAAANLTRHASGLGPWSFEDFERALREGVSRDGRPLREPMLGVVQGTKAMSPLERRALWSYLQSLPAASPNAG